LQVTGVCAAGCIDGGICVLRPRSASLINSVNRPPDHCPVPAAAHKRDTAPDRPQPRSHLRCPRRLRRCGTVRVNLTQRWRTAHPGRGVIRALGGGAAQGLRQMPRWSGGTSPSSGRRRSVIAYIPGISAMFSTQISGDGRAAQTGPASPTGSLLGTHSAQP
jgi:hypothetical protein